MNRGGGWVFAMACLAVLGCREQMAAQDFSRWSTFCGAAEHTAGVALGDLDNDGDLDVVFANGRHLAETDWVYSNDGRGTFYGRRALESQADRSYAVALGDVDGDGFLDAVVANDAGDRSIVYRNDGRGNLVSIAGLGSSTLAEGRRALALGDLDADGRIDVVLVGDGEDHVFINGGTGATWTRQALNDESGRGMAVVLGDFDSDGDDDVAVSYRGPGRILIYRNDGQGTLTLAQTLGSGHSDPTGLAVGDLNGDRHPDLVAVSWRREHTVHLNDGKGSFRDSRAFGHSAEQAWSVALGDVDLDGDLDAVVGTTDLDSWYDDFEGDGVPDRSGDRVRSVPSRIYVNDGEGGLAPGPAIGAAGDDTRPIALGDLDGDGDLDIVAGNDCQPSRVFFNPARAFNAR